MSADSPQAAPHHFSSPASLPNATPSAHATLPEWARTVSFWHVYPLGFCGAPIWDRDASESNAHDEASNNARIDRLRESLDYLISLGLNGLLLGPVFESVTHGYDTVDYFQCDRRLGTNADLERLIAACNDRGIKVVFDGVFSHAAASFVRPELLDAEAVFEGHGDLKRFDHSNPAVAEFVMEVMNYWLDKGISGWRLDAAYSVSPDFWAPVLAAVKDRHPDALLLGEVIHGDYAGIVAAAGMDTLTQYELWKAIWSSLKEENFFELDWTLKRHNEFLDSFIPQTFVGNHDVTRIASQVGPKKALLAATILFTVGGIPSVYYGDELGFEAIKEERFRGDDAIRPAFTAHPVANDITNAYKALIALRRTQGWLVDARTEVTAVSNQALSYRAYSGERELFISLEVADPEHPKATITDPFGAVLWAYAG